MANGKKKKLIRRKPPKRQIVSEPFIANRGDEIRYARQILSICRPMMKTVYREIVNLYRDNREAIALKKITSFTAGDEIFSALDALRTRYDNEFSLMAFPLADEMIKKQIVKVNRDFSDKMLKLAAASLPGSTGGVSAPPMAAVNQAAIQTQITPAFSVPGDVFSISPEMEIAVKASIEENVSLIKSIPGQFLDRVAGAVTRSMQSGGSTKQLAAEIKSYAGMTDRRAINIALDQTRKTYTALNIRRFQAAGIKKFKWIHVGGSVTPRHHHLENFPGGLNGGIFPLDDPPVIDPKTGIKGFPAQLPYCRCIMAAVFED
jgi:SPP1 gp7 family putative phage head morphogenesis protein